MDRTYELFGQAVDRCESLLERQFLLALLFSGEFSWKPVIGRGAAEIAEDARGIVLGQQVPVGEHRVDFALKRAGGLRRIAIEIDGPMHLSAMQVARDKVRDRTLLAAGWAVARFSSREIELNALPCARQVYGIAMRLPLESRPPIVQALPRTGQLLLEPRAGPLTG